MQTCRLPIGQFYTRCGSPEIICQRPHPIGAHLAQVTAGSALCLPRTSGGSRHSEYRAHTETQLMLVLLHDSIRFRAIERFGPSLRSNALFSRLRTSNDSEIIGLPFSSAVALLWVCYKDASLRCCFAWFHLSHNLISPVTWCIPASSE